LSSDLIPPSRGRPFASSLLQARAPLAKLVFFVIVSLALLVSDLNLRYLDAFRQGLSVLAYPLQMAAATPADFVRNASNYFSSLVRLQIENKELKSRSCRAPSACCASTSWSRRTATCGPCWKRGSASR
jgi:hypothetical protein